MTDAGALAVRRATTDDRSSLAELASRLQHRPDRHVASLALDAATIAEEMVAEDDDWTAVSAVATRDDSVVGWLMGSVDADMGRVWWFGPFVDVPADDDWPFVADELYRFAHQLLSGGVDEEEIAPDERFGALIRWALTLGFRRDPGSAVLCLPGSEVAAVRPPSIATRPVRQSDTAEVGALHDRLFPNTHTTGDRLVRGADHDHRRIVGEDGDTLIGYVAVERQVDGTGYIDYLGVDPAHRRRGFGAELVRAGVAALVELGCREMSLTVREDNHAARELYRGLGFREERIIVPLRRGFSIP